MKILLIGGLLAIFAGCATTPTASFYTLGASQPDEPVVQNMSRLSLAVGPIDLPQYLDRPQIVSRDGANRLRVDEFNRWGGALDEEIHRVVSARLAAAVGTQRIYRYPSRIVAATDYRLALDIQAFDGVVGGPVELDVAWSLIDDRSGEVVRVDRAHYVAGSASGDYAGYAATLRELLERLADDVATALRQAKKNPPRGAAGKAQ